MNAENIFRRLRGVVGNAIVWGAAWAASGLVVFTGLKAAGALSPSAIWLDGLMVAARCGVMGAIAGGVFSAAIGLLYRGRRLSEISWVRFGIGGGLAAGVFVPTFMTLARVLSGDSPLPLADLAGDTALAASFGAIAAGGSLWLAQHAQRRFPGGGHQRPGLLGSADPLAAAAARDMARGARRDAVPADPRR